MNSPGLRSGLLTLALGLATVDPAQGPDSARSIPATARTVSGRVVRPGAGEPRPVAGVTVTLHRVGPDTAGPLDSVHTGRDGRYTFRYRSFGSAEAIYFVSASYGGIAYFSSPLRDATVTGDRAELTVFDTTTGVVPLQVRGRHLVVSAIRPPAAGEPAPMRTVIEVYEISNDSSVTAVAGQGTAEHPTFTALLPADARAPTVGQGDVAAGAVTFRDGRALVFAPFAPGLKQLSLAYSLPASAFPLSVPIDRSVVVLEVLLEEPTGEASGAGLLLVNPVSMEGRTFRRFLAENVGANAVVRVVLPTGPAPRRATWLVSLLAIFAGTMAVVLAWALARRRRAPVRVAPAARQEIDRLAAEIASLDAVHEAHGDRAAGGAEEYRRRREGLKARLAARLAARDPGP